MGIMIFDGREKEVPFRSLNHKQTGMEFKKWNGARPRKTTPVHHVIHWTGGENSPEIMFRVLQKRGLGIEAAVDWDGTLYQFCDPMELDTFDAGWINPTSFGTEVINRGLWPEDRDHGTTASRVRLRRGNPQPEVIHGRRVLLANFTEAQIQTIHQLNLVLNSELGIPLRLPRFSDGSIIDKKMSRKEVRDFQGSFGHFHVSSRKLDPGLDVFRKLDATGCYA